MSQARLTEAAAGSTSSSHATIACPPTSASIRQPSPITVSSKSPFHSSTMRHPTLLGRSQVGGILTGRPSDRRYSMFQPLSIRPFWMTFRFPTSSPSTKQPWLASSTGFFLRVRPRFVDAPSPRGSTPRCRSLRRQARRHERQYRRTKLTADRSAWVHFVRDMHRSYREKERTYWETKIVSHAKDPKRLWATFDALLGRRRADRQPDVSLFSAEDFFSSFNDKINSIRLETAGADPPVYPATDCRLSAMVPVTGTELRRIILSSAAKSCELDPLPTFLLQELVDALLPFLTRLCNRSIQDGILPQLQKRSILIPVLKREGLNTTDPSNYRPIANVTFLSKIIERVAASQLIAYLEINKLLPVCQSGFRKGHSTETLLLRLLSDIYGAVDRSRLTLLALFDVSAAFDTVDHEILLKRLQLSFGLSGNFIAWLASFLSERSLCVGHGSSRSQWVPAPHGL